MQIKEVTARTGLTDRAIRLYIENGLVRPRQEFNYAGRRSISFDEEDVRTLEAVATLRRAEFSLADIARMQASPEALPALLAAHREKLAAQIAARQAVLDSMERMDARDLPDYRALADALRQPASQTSLPKEDSRMNRTDLLRLLRRRLPALLALVFLALAVFRLASLVFRTAFAEIYILPGGGYQLEYRWDIASAAAHAVPLLSLAALVLAAAALVGYLAGGARRWLLAAGALCAVSALLLLVMPAADAERMYTFEFIDVRFGLLRDLVLGVGTTGARAPRALIQSFKYGPILIALALAAVSFFTDRKTEDAEA